MSCYQVLALDNNKGDLSITQGNTVNLVQVIQNFSVKTPVVDFKIDGQVLELYYRDATGALQLKTVTLPAAGNNNSTISVASTTTINASIAAGVIISSVKVSATSGNALTVNPDGLFVSIPTQALQIANSSSISLTYTAGLLQAAAIISPAAGNALAATDTGLYVSPTTLSNSQVRNLFSAVAPIQFDPATGIISETVAGTTTNGYLLSTDWNTFNNKVSNGVTVGSVSSTAVFKQNAANVLQFRGVTAGSGVSLGLIGDDIIISTTATVPVVNAGSAQTITTPTAAVTMNGSAIVSTGNISGVIWSLIAGPNVPVITDTSSLSTTVTGLIAGVYRFRLSAIANTGLVGTSTITVTVNSGSITLDTIYWGAQAGPTAPDATGVAAGSSNSQNGSNDVTVNYISLTSSTPLYCWFAIPNLGGNYFKTKYFMDSLNKGNIGSSSDLFGGYTQVTVGGVVYNVSITNYATQFTESTVLQA